MCCSEAAALQGDREEAQKVWTLWPKECRMPESTRNRDVLAETLLHPNPVQISVRVTNCTCSGSTYTTIGTTQRRLAWPLREDDTQIHEVSILEKRVSDIWLGVKKERHLLPTEQRKQYWKGVDSYGSWLSLLLVGRRFSSMSYVEKEWWEQERKREREDTLGVRKILLSRTHANDLSIKSSLLDKMLFWIFVDYSNFIIFRNGMV